MLEKDALAFLDEGLISLARAARVFGQHRDTIAKKLRAAGVPPQRRERAHLYPVAEIARALLVPAAASATDIAGGATRAELLDRKLAVEVRTAELDYYERAGELVRADDVRRQAFDAGRRIRDALMQLPERLAPELAVEEDAHSIRARIEGEIRMALGDESGQGNG